MPNLTLDVSPLSQGSHLNLSASSIMCESQSCKFYEQDWHHMDSMDTHNDCCCHMFRQRFRLICDVLRCFKFQVLCDISQDIRPGYEGYRVESLNLHQAAQAGRKPEMGETWEPEPGLSYRTSRTLILAEQRLSWPSPPRPEEGHGNMACLLIH